MDRDEALRELHQIVDGIDRDEADLGWCETSTGQEFGADRLRLLENLIVRLTTPGRWFPPTPPTPTRNLPTGTPRVHPK